MAIEIVDFPFFPLKMVIFHSYVNSPDGNLYIDPAISLDQAPASRWPWEPSKVSMCGFCSFEPGFPKKKYGCYPPMQYIYMYIYIHIYMCDTCDTGTCDTGTCDMVWYGMYMYMYMYMYMRVCVCAHTYMCIISMLLSARKPLNYSCFYLFAKRSSQEDAPPSWMYRTRCVFFYSAVISWHHRYHSMYSIYCSTCDKWWLNQHHQQLRSRSIQKPWPGVWGNRLRIERPGFTGHGRDMVSDRQR